MHGWHLRFEGLGATLQRVALCIFFAYFASFAVLFLKE